MTPPPRTLAALLGASGVLLVLTLLLADWNWARPAVVRYIEQKSQREVQVDDLQIRLDADWQPVVRLRGLRVANAPWADGTRPFITAREASFTFDWATLFSPVRVMRLMHLVDADVDLQRQPDGLRNWRLTRPDDRGGARMRVLRLQAERSRLTLTHRGLGLTLEARSTPLDRPHGGHTQQIRFQGRYADATWSGQAEVGPVLSMVDTGERFALSGEARSGDTAVAVTGEIADLMQLSAVDAHVQLRGDTLAQLRAFLPRAEWPASVPYRFDGRLARDGASWVARQARLTLGRSDVAGDARFTPARSASEGRASLQATLKSERLRLGDLPSRPGEQATAAARPQAAASSLVLPQRALALDTLRHVDGRIAWQIGTLEAPKWPVAHGLAAIATLDGGEVQVQLQQGELAGGRWQGRFALDTRGKQPEAALQLKASGVSLTQLWPSLQHRPHLDDVKWPAVDGSMKLTTEGQTLAHWWSGVDGRLDLQFTGGSLPRKLDARLGLHAGRMLSTLVGGDKPVPIRCGALSLAFSGGVGRTRELVLETERTQVHGIGSVHLADESWALVLTPEAHGGTLPASIVAKGTFRGAKVEMAPREPVPPAPHGGGCA